jgi:hypothetical protein
VQWEGGPCAVLAPVQAFILKSLLQDANPSSEKWRKVRKRLNLLASKHQDKQMLLLGGT